MNTKTNIKKLSMAALLTAVAVVGSMFSFPFLGAKCSPVQHLVNIIGGVYLGPWYSLGMAFCASLIRNITGLGSPMAFPGSMVGAFLSGVMFHWVFKNKSLAVRLPAAYVGELFGTSVIGGMLSFPIAYFVMKNTAATLFGFVFPFFASSVVGTVIAAVLVTSMKRVRVFDTFLGNEAKNT
ncbi:MAG: energy coupling factor transporter S component ThiW [Oscillospiraceae bacterium]|nr:energy coupling factor transporter S component ThiW [Oscillospiraceae bacterium]